MAPITSLPPNLIHQDFKTNLPPKSEASPIRFCPQWTRKESSKKEKEPSVKITINTDVTKTYFIFSSGNMEEAIRLVRLHEAIIVDKGLKKSISTLKSQRKEKVSALKVLEEDDASRTDHETAIGEIETQISQLGKQPFDIFEKLLGPDLQIQWRSIVKKECDRAGAMSLEGVALTTPCGRILSAMRPCYHRFTALFGPPNSAELAKRYMSINLVLNLDRVSVLQAVSRLHEMNDMLLYLPSLKH